MIINFGIVFLKQYNFFFQPREELRHTLIDRIKNTEGLLNSDNGKSEYSVLVMFDLTGNTNCLSYLYQY